MTTTQPDFTLVRMLSASRDRTIGALYEGAPSLQSFLCLTLEDIEREGAKVFGSTAIPRGVYELGLRTEGAMHPKYAQRFPAWHRGMIWLQDVPGFEYVYLHIGNTARDTLGCVLLGLGYDGVSLSHSAAVYDRIGHRITDLIVQRRSKGEVVRLAVTGINEVSACTA